MIINMEFGAFDKERAILPLTMFDNKMDRKSVVSTLVLFHCSTDTRNLLCDV